MAGAVRQPVNVESLSAYIDKTVPQIKIPIDVKQFGFGQSNPTYQITDANNNRYVLRKKPPGKLLSKTAHQVEREYRIIHALEKTDVPVPKAYCLCVDEGVIGTAFYIMEFLDGRIVEDASFPEVGPEERREMWHDAIRTLAKLHRVDPSFVNLLNFGKPSGFYNRQIKTLGTISTSQAQVVDIESKQPVGKIPHFDDMVSFFGDPKTQPKDRGTLIHGDYKIDNLVFHKTEPRVIGILDWEMSTIGHPLSDLSNLLFPYVASAANLYGRSNPAISPSTATPGLPTRIECINWYAEVAGWDPSQEQGWGDAFGCFRNSVIMQGIAARYALRQASSAKAKEYAVQTGPFAEFAWSLIEMLRESGCGQKAKL
ncbi:aminoglycoside phosphotransferase [Lasallia pustulata]|uniref:Aminoglycoside phosphotransferase n=1 Tax=Lasallia pustulata TaxID=136370 RepID=A0A1W5DA77_9LECA|nr:aminoglycoside phosphotransferase [Lasallia pustulata]